MSSHMRYTEFDSSKHMVYALETAALALNETHYAICRQIGWMEAALHRCISLYSIRCVSF